MTYLPTLHAYLHQSSLLLQAYPHSTRITTKYSLPRKVKTKPDSTATTSESEATTTAVNGTSTTKPKRDPSATLTLKTYHPDSGICLKYRTDKAAEVGRLVTGLGRLAKGEIIELPTAADGEGVAGSGIAIGGGETLSGAGGGAVALDEVQAKTAAQMTQQQIGAGKKKKKGKK